MIWLGFSLFLLFCSILISSMMILGRRLLKELTQPGIIIKPGTPEWGDLVFPEAESEAPCELQRALFFRSVDGVLLHGEFWAQAHKAPTIIISHGYRCPSIYFRSVAAIAYAHGVNILLFDYRAHGKSGGRMTTCGISEVHDLVAAIQVATNQPETAPDQVFVHGFSMGAAVAFLLPEDSAVAGVIADSAYASLDQMILPFVKQTFFQETAGWRGPARLVRLLIPALANVTLIGGQALFYIRHHRQLIARPDRHIGYQKTPILLIHAKNDPLTDVKHAKRLATAARKAGRAIREYYTPSQTHCGSYGHDPHQYVTLLWEFVTRQSLSMKSEPAS